MKGGSLLLCVLLVGSGWAQHLPARDDPLYDYRASLQPVPAAILRLPQSADELLPRLEGDERPAAQLARWKLNAAPTLPEQLALLTVELQGFAFPERSEWQTAASAYRVAGAWSLSPHALLEVVWSDTRRRESANPEAFGTIPYARLTVQTGTVRWQIGYSTLRWSGGYSGGLLVNDEMPPVAHLKVQFPLQVPLLGEWRFEQFLSQFEQEGKTIWWGARRFERDFGARWTLALAEAFKALEFPEGAVSQLVPYYLYQKWYSTASRGSGWFNYLAEVGVIYRAGSQTRLYLFWLLDDMRAPTALGGASTTPRKVATLVGVRLHPTPESRLILELVRSDGTRTGGVYDASGHDPRYAYYYKQLPMGHPVGANQVGLYARADYERGRWLLALDYTTLRRFHEYRPGVRGYLLEGLVGYQLSGRSLLVLRYRARSLREEGAPDVRAGWMVQAIARF